ncbi:predicted protein [Postia placenta Mad-698-R]|uniref:Uncharacterized protein n=1 Tax=Postia placenta MAD-698-R-SB12 TaxID=670580 RepID=A0A1X6N7D6_9APHY|nr:hypothetical protein POSPLADRAFT_1045557 [Postia placenta MAD-698-R-SB12]EED83777.1 predicted protein [Postia placenta Mad-698-R]OSX64535.1 hypothetical protein POSPLADRAFT_1045557 [Postia placenta MAD-698-R-SB12]
MSLFQGQGVVRTICFLYALTSALAIAFFSPSVPAWIQQTWCKWVVPLARLFANEALILLFKGGPTDGAVLFLFRKARPMASKVTYALRRIRPSLTTPARLLKRSVAVFHSSWIPETAAAQFQLPLGRYVLDDSSDRCAIATPSSTLSTQTHSSPGISSQRSLTVESSPLTPPRIQNAPRKRSLPSDDEPVSEPRPRKKARNMDFDSEAEVLFIVSSVAPRPAERLKTRSRKIPEIDFRRLAPHSSRLPPLEYEPVKLKPMPKSNVWNTLLDTNCSSPRVSVSVALHALRDVSTANSTRFTPGSTHLGKQLTCSYTKKVRH